MNAHRDFLRGATEAARRQADTLDALAVGMGGEPEAEHEARRLRANADRLDAALDGPRADGPGRDAMLVILGAILGAAAVALLPPLLQMAGWLS